MNNRIRLIVAGVFLMTTLSVSAQKIDDDRMQRDVEVAENILKTLIKQKFDKRSFLPIEISGRYLPGYGVTFRVPSDSYSPWLISVTTNDDEEAPVIVGRPDAASYTFTYSEGRKVKRTERVDRDSSRTVYNEAIVEIAKEFLADYGDLIGQLNADEKIVVTNRAGEEGKWYHLRSSNSGALLMVEATRGDITQLRQGKISRADFIKKIKVVNAESVDELSPDLELFSSIMQRVYDDDLSKTYFTNEDMYYERLKDFGVIYYMQVYSSRPDRNKRHQIPTLQLEDVDQATRDQKVKELYPQFEKELKENVLEYGRTIKSLSEKENLVLNVKVTTCEGCGIPSTLELSVDGGTLKDYLASKISKDTALGRINVKKGTAQ